MTREQPQLPRLLTVDQAASELNISRSTLYRWIGRSWVRTIPIGMHGRGKRIPAEEIDRFVRERLVDASD